MLVTRRLRTTAKRSQRRRLFWSMGPGYLRECVIRERHAVTVDCCRGLRWLLGHRGGEFGDFVHALRDMSKLNYVSTAGGALIRYLSGVELPLIKAMVARAQTSDTTVLSDETADPKTAGNTIAQAHCGIHTTGPIPKEHHPELQARCRFQTRTC